MVRFERGKKRENNEGRRTHFRSRSCLCVCVCGGGGAPEAALQGDRKETSEAFRQPAAQQTRLSSEAGWKSSGLLPSITGFSSCGSRSLLSHVSLPRIIFGSLGAPCSLPASHHSVPPPFLHGVSLSPPPVWISSQPLTDLSCTENFSHQSRPQGSCLLWICVVPGVFTLQFDSHPLNI